jgi:hypothetical protein
MAENGRAGLNHTTQWLFGMLVVVFIGLISYVWVDRESRISGLEGRIEARDQAWHSARLALHSKISELEYEIKALKARMPPERHE